MQLGSTTGTQAFCTPANVARLQEKQRLRARLMSRVSFVEGPKAITSYVTRITWEYLTVGQVLFCNGNSQKILVNIASY